MNTAFMPLDPALDAEFCNLILGWDALERRLGNEMFLDQNMIGWKNKNSYDHRTEVVRDLTRLRDTYPHNDNYGRQLDRLLFYVGDLINPHASSPEERIEKLVGVKFQMFPDDMISQARTRVIEKASALGFAFDEHLETRLEDQDRVTLGFLWHKRA